MSRQDHATGTSRNITYPSKGSLPAPSEQALPLPRLSEQRDLVIAGVSVERPRIETRRTRPPSSAQLLRTYEHLAARVSGLPALPVFRRSDDGFRADVYTGEPVPYPSGTYGEHETAVRATLVYHGGWLWRLALRRLNSNDETSREMITQVGGPELWVFLVV